ncbi:helix-turn-helix domain-containing protein [Gordonia sp. HNM0687]|uniref:Helix-turn-helix domain-containing protein n=1 Tax=Gordonia mangrovi TaxID=2665643 RepID=A0A6L7GLK3_9ACTN|nr:GyrI-like domain-containing protein [Gordonia mangrovi]MXP20756.1 helix-turn-helix domain-containing protein [Gordonia mangrovi]UVF78674.1 GyrI-like domain-containing protein [Gordonia mangrovi]
MIATLNALVDLVDRHADVTIDVARFARAHGTTEYHLRRMFAALAMMPLSEYVRRRRMTLAATDLVSTEAGLLDIAIRYGYSSTEAFGRAFRSVHGVSAADVRRDGGPLRTQPMLRFRLSVEGSTPMDVTITERPALVLAGCAAQVPLIHRGVNPHIQEHIASIPPAEHARLKALGDTDPAGILAVTAGQEPDAPEGTPVTYLHGVAVRADSTVPDDLDTVSVDAGAWATFHSSGPFPDALQQTWAATATEWFPSNPWRLRPGPSILRYLELTETHAVCEIWLPIERA